MLNFARTAQVGQRIVKHSGLVTSISNWLMRPTGVFAVRPLSQRLGSLGSAQGRTRDGNQDRVLAVSFEGLDASESFELFAVCDGMGGLQEGAQCASLALSTILAVLVRSRRDSDRENRLRRAVELANRSIHERYRERGGTTVAAILLTRSGATGIAVGDTRIYLHDRAGNLSQLTVDDTIAERVAEIQGHQGASFENAPFANHLAQFVGQSGPLTPQLIDVSEVFWESSPGVQAQGSKGLLLTSDGVHKMPKEILSGVARSTDVPREVVSRLIYISEWSGGSDNESAMYLRAGVRDAHVRDIRRRHEGAPSLFLQDAFGEWSLVFSIPEEFADRNRYVDSPPRPVSLVRDAHRKDVRDATLEPGGMSGPGAVSRQVHEQVNEGADSQGTPQALKVDVDPQRERSLNSATESISRGAREDKRFSNEAVPRKRTKAKGGKGVKRKKKETHENAQPELDILISHEPE